jgi:transcriptional regulator with XRE-family HTH domain
MAAIGQCLRRLRERKGITQLEMARACGVSQSAWSRVENGRNDLSMGHLRRAAALLGMPMWVVIKDAESAR